MFPPYEDILRASEFPAAEVILNTDNELKTNRMLHSAPSHQARLFTRCFSVKSDRPCTKLEFQLSCPSNTPKLSRFLPSTEGRSPAPAQPYARGSAGVLSNALQAGLDKMQDFARMSQPPHPVSLLLTLRPCLYLKHIPIKQYCT